MRQVSPDSRPDLLPAGLEDLLDQIATTDRLDRGEETRSQTVVIGRKKILGVGGDVIEVARAADAVALGPSLHEVRFLQCPELLENAGSACPKGSRELVGRGWTVMTEP